MSSTGDGHSTDVAATRRPGDHTNSPPSPGRSGTAG